MLASAFVLTLRVHQRPATTLANAVATVIYTSDVPSTGRWMLRCVQLPRRMLLAWCRRGLRHRSPAPVELPINVNTGHGLAMVFSLLAAAIAWNLGTWYFGIPASSSHTLIGSILGVGLSQCADHRRRWPKGSTAEGDRHRPVADLLAAATASWSPRWSCSD
ncbi:inorganic phosphate transporter [Pseudomonas aeruginosa]